jgi:uncharacterized protein YcfJ
MMHNSPIRKTDEETTVDKSLVAGIAIGVAVATAGGAVAGYKMMDRPQYAEVLDVKPIKDTIRTPRQECHDEVVTHRKPVKDQNRIAGTAIGAVVGGLLGNQVGGGRGKTVATVAGAAAGGYAGNKTQEHMQDGDTYTTTEQRCKTVTDSQEKISGYEVRYRLKGKEDTVRMDHEPGDKIPVKDGQLVLNDSEPSNSEK